MSEDTTKIISFPKHKVVREIPDEIHKERKAKADQKLADSIVDEIAGLMITEMDNYLIEVESKQFAKDFILVVDALRATIYRQFGIDHHLHGYIDNNITVIDAGMEKLSKEEIREKIETILESFTNMKEELDTEGDK